MADLPEHMEGYLLKLVQNWYGEKKFIRKFKLDMQKHTLE